MRSNVLKIVLGCGILAATIVPTLACSYNTQASSDNQQQTAQAQQQTDTKTQ